MSKTYVLSVRDRSAATFGAPFCSPSVGLAVRQFADEINRQDQNNMLYKHPEDFDLYQIGTFDDETGSLEPEIPRQVSIGKDHVKLSQ